MTYSISHSFSEQVQGREEHPNRIHGKVQGTTRQGPQRWL